MVELLPVADEHCLEISKTARHPDMGKLQRVIGKTTYQIIKDCVSASIFSRAVVIDGDLVAVSGFKKEKLSDAHVEIWIWAGSLVLGHRRAFLRAFKQWADQALEIYPGIIAAIDERFTESIKMALWIGFKELSFYDDEKTGVRFRLYLKGVV